MARYASGKNALAICDRCGFQYKLHTLKNEFVNGRRSNVRVCETCWDVDHPQNKLGSFRIDDPRAIRDPRPDNAGYPESRGYTYQPLTQNILVSLGDVTVTVS